MVDVSNKEDTLQNKIIFTFQLPSFILAQSGASAALISTYKADITLEYIFGLTSIGMTCVPCFNKLSAQWFQCEHVVDTLQWSGK